MDSIINFFKFLWSVKTFLLILIIGILLIFLVDKIVTSIDHIRSFVRGGNNKND